MLLTPDCQTQSNTMAHDYKSKPRDTFGSKFGIIAAVAGSAIGLGNIWKFPYMAGANGGSAFLLIYLVFLLILGVPAMMAEFTVGRKGRANAFTSFANLTGGSAWKWVGMMGILSSFFILAFYSTVAGWTLDYIVRTFTFKAPNGPFTQPEAYFAQFSASGWLPILYQVIFILATALVVKLGVTKGIERTTKWMMPILLLLMVIIVIRSVTLPGAAEGVSFLFKPDFSKVTIDTCLNAMGQAFFSLSLAAGVVLIYGSYVKSTDNMMTSTASVAISSTVVAVLAGLMIFPATFSFGVAPTSGPNLIYVALPSIFRNMVGGQFFALLFFILLAMAALTSTISMLEAVIGFVSEHFHISRSTAIWISIAAVAIFAIPATLSFMPEPMHLPSWLGGKTVFGSLDFLTSNILMPAGCLLTVLFVSWGPGRKWFQDEVTNGGTIGRRWYKPLGFLLKWVTPVLVAVILVWGVL